jgi:hypothetical protein
MSSDCVTIRLTTEQQDQLRRLTGRTGEALMLHTEQLDELLVDELEPPGEFEAGGILNPYP